MRAPLLRSLFRPHRRVCSTCLLSNVSARTEYKRVARVVSTIPRHCAYLGNVLRVFGARNLSLFAHNTTFCAHCACVLSMPSESAQSNQICTEYLVHNTICGKVMENIDINLASLLSGCLALRQGFGGTSVGDHTSRARRPFYSFLHAYVSVY